MKQASLICGFLSLIIASSISCADQHNTRGRLLDQHLNESALGPMDVLARDMITVVDEHQRPVANATVLLGYEVGNPFPGNSLTTNANGVAAVPNDWKAALPVTVQAQCYVTATLPVSMPGTMTIQISLQESQDAIEIKGKTTDFGRLINDGKAHVGLVVPGIDPKQILSFDMSTVLSPQVDTITVIGNTVSLPSNITLPDQTVTYIFPIRLNKPDYRSYVRNPGPYLMSATHASFPFQRVVNDIRGGKSIFEVINFFTFIEGAQKEINVTGNIAGVDLAVNAIPFKTSVSVKAPALDANQVMVGVSLREQNGLLMPTDIKRFASGQSMNLTTSPTPPSLLSLLMVDANSAVGGAMATMSNALSPINPFDSYLNTNAQTERKAQSFAQLSFAMQSSVNGATPQFLSLISAPIWDANYILKMSPPVLPSGLTSVATYMVLTEIKDFNNGGVNSEQATRLWEVWSDGWLNQVELPKLPIQRKTNCKYRWQVMYMARPVGAKFDEDSPNRVDIKTITHVTRNTLDI